MRKTLWLAVFLLLARLCFAQAPPAPLTRDWLAAFNSGDRSTTLQCFLEKYRPSDVAHIDGLINFHSRTGGLDFEKVEESNPTHCAALVKEQDSDQFARLGIDVDPDPPHQIVDELEPSRYCVRQATRTRHTDGPFLRRCAGRPLTPRCLSSAKLIRDVAVKSRPSVFPTPVKGAWSVLATAAAHRG